MDASLMKASALRLRFSQSLASLRQRYGAFATPGLDDEALHPIGSLTISVSRSGRMPARAR